MRSTNFGPLVTLKLENGGKVDRTRRALLGLLGKQQPSPLATVSNPPVQITPQPAASPLATVVERAVQTPMSRREFMEKTGKTVGAQAVQDITGGVGLGSIAKEVSMSALPTQKLSQLKAIEDGVKDWAIDSVFERIEDPVEIMSWVSGWLPYIKSNLSAEELNLIKKAETLANKYGDEGIPEDAMDLLYEGLDVAQEAITGRPEVRQAIKNKLPTEEFIHADMSGNEQIGIDELLDYATVPGVEKVSPEVLNQLKNKQWAKDLIYELGEFYEE